MTTKKKESTSEKKGRVKVGKLKLNKETVEELGDSDLKEVQGGAGAGGRTGPCVAGQGFEPQPINRPGQSYAGDPICD